MKLRRLKILLVATCVAAGASLGAVLTQALINHWTGL